MTKEAIKLGRRSYVIGEVAQAHDGSLGTAHAYIDAIADSGADAVKFQTHIASAESTPHEQWRVRFSRQDETRYEYWKRMEFTESQWLALALHARERGLFFVSSPFSLEAVEMLDKIRVDAWKIASGELANIRMLERIVQAGQPVLLSTGMNSLEEIDGAVNVLGRSNADIAILQCTSIYPTPYEKVGLNMISVLQGRYGVPVGLSDHSGTVYPCLAAAALGASVFEVHVTFNRRMFGPDVGSSVTFEEFSDLVQGVRAIERMNSHPIDKDETAQLLEPTRKLFFRSIVTNKQLEAGHVLTEQDLALKKPGSGLSESRLQDVVGRRLSRSVEADCLLEDSDLE